MLYEKVQLEEKDETVFLEVYVADKIADFVRNAILVIPGGGYEMVCSEREGEPVAMAFMPYGYNAFVLHYSVKKAPFPVQLIQASKAMKYIKDNAKRYNIDSSKVFTVGFSAGGHLAASLGTMWDRKEIYEEISMPLGYNKPAGMMLVYPVMSSGNISHFDSFKNLLCTEEPTATMLSEVSIENHINKNSSPAYIVHTSNDSTVDVRNSLTLANELATQGIKFEMHIYPDGPHGIALANKITKCDNDKWCDSSTAEWVKNAVNWAEKVSE